MDINLQLDLVKKKTSDEIAQYTQRKKINRGAAFAFAVVPATLSAIATVSIGISETVGVSWLAIIAMVATAIVAVLGIWESMFNNRKLWRVNNIMLTKLYVLQSDMEYRELDVSKPIRQEEIDQFYSRLMQIMLEGAEMYDRAVGA